MRRTIALKKQVKVSVNFWTNIFNKQYVELTINDMPIGKLGGKCIDNLGNALNTQFVGDYNFGDKKCDFVADTMKIFNMEFEVELSTRPESL